MGFRGEQTSQPIPLESIGKERPNLRVIQGGSETDLLLADIQDALRKELSPTTQEKKHATEDLIPEITRTEYEKLKEQFTDVSNNPVARRIHRDKMLGAIFGNQRDIDTLYIEAQNIAEHTGVNPAIARSVRKRELAEFEDELKTKPISEDDLVLIKHFSSLGHPLAADILKHYEARTSQERIAEIQEKLLGPETSETPREKLRNIRLKNAAFGNERIYSDLLKEYAKEYGEEGKYILDTDIKKFQESYRGKKLDTREIVNVQERAQAGSTFARELLDAQSTPVDRITPEAISKNTRNTQENYTINDREGKSREERAAEIKKHADESKLFRAALGDRNLLRDLRQEYLNEFGPEGITKLDNKILDIQREYRKKEITPADVTFLKSMTTLGSDFAQELLDKYYERNRNKPPQNTRNITQAGTPIPIKRQSTLSRLTGFFKKNTGSQN